MDNNYNTFIDREAFNIELNKINNNLEETYKKINNLFHQDLYVLNKKSYHFVKDFLQPRNEFENIFYSTLLRSITQTELLSGNTSYFSLLYAIELFKTLQKQPGLFVKQSNTKLENEYRKFWEGIKDSVQNNTVIANEKDLKNLIESVCENDQLLTEVIWNAIKLAGIEGKIFIENGKTPNYVVELKEGYSFDLNPFNMLMPKNSSYKRYDAKVLVIDGIIEQVSEIDQLLLKAQETHQPLIIISQGFSEEVVATCKINNDRNNFDIMPIRLKHDIQSLNQINDIGVVCGMMPISSLMGQTLSLIKWEDIPIVKEISISKTETVINNNQTRDAVSTQIKMILEKKQDGHFVEDVQAIYDKRLKSLVSNSVIIQLPEMDLMSIDSARIKIDLVLRNLKPILNYGMINIQNVTQELKTNSEFEKMILSSLKRIKEDMPNNISSQGFLISTLVIGKTILLLLNSSGCVIEV